MDQFIARANIDRYLDMLHHEGTSLEYRFLINKFLIDEEGKLARDMSELEFAEARAARYRSRCHQLERWRDGFPEGSTERAGPKG